MRRNRESDDSPMLQNSDIEMQLHTERKDKYVPKSAIISPKPRNLFNQGSIQRGFSFATSGPLSGPRFGARAADKENHLRRRKIASALGSHSGNKDDDNYKFHPIGLCNDIHCYSCVDDYKAKEKSEMTSGSSPNRWVSPAWIISFSPSPSLYKFILLYKAASFSIQLKIHSQFSGDRLED